MHKLMCKEIVMELLCDYLDRALSPDVIAELERHLKDCKPCLAYLNTYRKTRDLTGQAGRVEMPKEMKARLHQFLLAQLAKKKS